MKEQYRQRVEERRNCTWVRDGMQSRIVRFIYILYFSAKSIVNPSVYSLFSLAIQLRLGPSSGLHSRVYAQKAKSKVEPWAAICDPKEATLSKCTALVLKPYPSSLHNGIEGGICWSRGWRIRGPGWVVIVSPKFSISFRFITVERNYIPRMCIK